MTASTCACGASLSLKIKVNASHSLEFLSCKGCGRCGGWRLYADAGKSKNLLLEEKAAIDAWRGLANSKATSDT